MLGRGRVTANDSKLSRNYFFRKHFRRRAKMGREKKRGKKTSLRPWRRVVLRLRSCGAWAYYDSLCESRRSEIDAKFVPQEPPAREEPMAPAEPAPKKGRDEHDCNRQRRSSDASFTIQICNSRNPSKRNRNQISHETWGAHSQNHSLNFSKGIRQGIM